MSANNSKKLLQAKIEYKKGLLEAEKNMAVENIKPVENQAVSPKKATLIRSMFSKAVAEIKKSFVEDYATEFAQKKSISTFINKDLRNQKVREGNLSC